MPVAPIGILMNFAPQRIECCVIILYFDDVVAYDYMDKGFKIATLMEFVLTLVFT